jgi:mannose-6-phosphate isomerase-like protein (cupin superfamily)
MNQEYQFIQKFFNPTYPEKIILDKSHTRVIHGAHALPLYYHKGFRSAWYFLEKGQRLNKPGDTNPFSQAFVIISGEGLAKIGDETFPVMGNETYMIPPLTEHMLWADNEPITLIYLAWGEGA